MSVEKLIMAEEIIFLGQQMMAKLTQLVTGLGWPALVPLIPMASGYINAEQQSFLINIY